MSEGLNSFTNIKNHAISINKVFYNSESDIGILGNPGIANENDNIKQHHNPNHADIVKLVFLHDLIRSWSNL
jgi:hypothetical protein